MAIFDGDRTGPSPRQRLLTSPGCPPVSASARLLWPLLTARSAACSVSSPFQVSGELSPGKSPDLPCTAAGSTPPDPWLRELRGHWPARPGRLRLVSGSCSSAHRCVPRFLRPRHRGPHLAVPFGPCNQVPGGLAPPSQCPCWAHQKKRRGRQRSPPARRSPLRSPPYSQVTRSAGRM